MPVVRRAQGPAVVATRSLLLASSPAALAAMDAVVFEDMVDFGTAVWAAAFRAAARVISPHASIDVSADDLCETVGGMLLAPRVADWLVARCVRAADSANRARVVTAARDMGYGVDVCPTSFSWIRVTRPGRSQAAPEDWFVPADRRNAWHRALLAAMAAVDGHAPFGHGERERRKVRGMMLSSTLVDLVPSPLLGRRP